MIFKSNDQYKHIFGPLDAKALVETFELLCKESTWLLDGMSSAYNGMITAVWLDPDESKNGVYFLHDPAITATNSWEIPNVTKASNWHKMGGINCLPGLESQIAGLKTRLDQTETAIDTLSQKTTTLTADVATLRSEVETWRTQVPTIDEINGGTASIN